MKEFDVMVLIDGQTHAIGVDAETADEAEYLALFVDGVQVVINGKTKCIDGSDGGVR